MERTRRSEVLILFYLVTINSVGQIPETIPSGSFDYMEEKLGGRDKD